MLLNYTKGEGFGGLLGKGVNNLLSLKDTKDFLIDVDDYGLDNLSPKQIDEFASAYDRLNPKALEYVNNVKNGNIQLKEGQTLLDGFKNRTSIFEKLGTKIKSVASGILNIIGKLSSTFVNGIVSLGISWGITKIIGKVNDLRKELGLLTKGEIKKLNKEVIEAGETAASNIDSISKKYTESAKTVKEVSDEYAKLAQGVKDLGLETQSQGSLSTEEYERFLEISNQLAEIFPSLKVGITDEGDALLSLNGSTETITESLENLLKVEKELASQKIQDNMSKVWGGYGKKVNQASVDYNKAVKNLEKYQGIREQLSDLQGDMTWEEYTLQFGNTDILEDFLKEAGYDFEDLKNQTIDTSFVDEEFDAIIEKYKNKMDEAKSIIEAENQKLGSLIALSFEGNTQYEKLGAGEKNIVNQTLSNLQYDTDYFDQRNKDDWEDVYNNIQRRVLNTISRLEQETPELAERFSNAYSRIMNFEGDNGSSVNTYLNDLQMVRDTINGLKTDQSTKDAMLAALPDDSELEGKINHLKELMGENFEEGMLNTLTSQDLEVLAKIKVKPGSEKYTKEEIEELLNPIEVEIEPEVKNADAVKNLNDLESNWSGLDTVYTSTVTESGTADAKDIESVNSSLGGVSKAGDEEINALSNALEAYNKTLVESKGNSEEAQNAADKLATAYIDQTDVLKDLTEENKDYYIEMLENNGVTNAEKVVMTRLGKQARETAKALASLSKALVNNYDIIKDGNPSVEGYNDAIKSVKDEVQKLLTVYNEDGTENVSLTPELDNGFIIRNLEDIKAATEGDVEALSRLRLEIARVNAEKAYPDIGIPSDVINAQLDGIMDKVAQADAMDIDVGAYIEDSQFLSELANMMSQSSAAADAISAAFASMGYDVEWTDNTWQGSILKSTNGGVGLPTEVAEKLKSQVELNVPSLKIKRTQSSGGAKTSYGGSKGSSNGGGSNGGGDGGSSNNDKANEDTEETFDWIEVAITRIEEEIGRLDKVIDDTYDNWANRNTAITKKIEKLGTEIKAQTTAQEEYLRNAKEVAINDGKALDLEKDYDNDSTSEQYQYDLGKYNEAVAAWATGEYQKKVREGLMSGNDIEKIANKYLVEAIQKYQELYNKSVAAGDAIKDLQIQVKDQYKQLYENIIKEYDDVTTGYTKEADIIQKRMERMEEHGYFVDSSYYDDLIDIENKKIKNQSKELEEATKKVNEFIAAGVTSGEAYEAAKQALQDVNLGLEESRTNLVKLQKEQRQLRWDRFEWLEEQLADISEEAEHLIKLFDSEKLFDDQGYLTNKGYAKLGLIGVEFNDSIAKLQRYKDEYAEAKKELEEAPNDQNAIDHYNKVVEGMRSATEGMTDNAEKLRSVFEEAVNKHLEALQKVIDKTKEQLSVEKDLYDFQKNLANQTKNIANLEKQLAAYSGDDSEETRKKRQELQKQLDEAQQQLQETEWDRYISETNQMLDDLKEDYEEYLNGKLDDFMGLANNMINVANDNTAAIKEGMTEIKNQYGITTEHFEKFGDTEGTLLTTLQDGGEFSNKVEAIKTIVGEFKSSMESVADPEKNGLRAAVEKLSKDIVALENKQFELQNTKAVKEEEKKNNGGKEPEVIDGIVDTFNWGKMGEWKSDDKGYWYQYNDGNIPKDKWSQIDGNWYYFDDKGYMATNQYRSDGKGGYSWVGENGAYNSSWNAKWKKDDDGYYWLEYSDGSYPTNQWLEIDGKWYYFDSEGYMVTGRQWLGGKSYSFGTDGHWLGYATGTQNVPKDNLYWTQEKGSELIYKTSSGAMLTPLNQGDMVFTHDMSQRLWEIAAGNIPVGSGIVIPDISSDLKQDITANNNITIELPNVQNYDDFKRELKNDTEFEKFMQEVTIGQVMGNNKLNKKKY